MLSLPYSLNFMNISMFLPTPDLIETSATISLCFLFTSRVLEALENSSTAFSVYCVTTIRSWDTSAKGFDSGTAHLDQR